MAACLLFRRLYSGHQALMHVDQVARCWPSVPCMFVGQPPSRGMAKKGISKCLILMLFCRTWQSSAFEPPPSMWPVLLWRDDTLFGPFLLRKIVCIWKKQPGRVVARICPRIVFLASRLRLSICYCQAMVFSCLWTPFFKASPLGPFMKNRTTDGGLLAAIHHSHKRNES